MIVLKYVGNLLCSRLHRLCEINHGEYITNHKKHKKHGNENYTYIKYNLHRVKGYVVQVNKLVDAQTDCLDIREQHVKKVRILMKHALENGVSEERLKCIVSECADEVQKSKYMCSCFNDVMFFK